MFSWYFAPMILLSCKNEPKRSTALTKNKGDAK